MLGLTKISLDFIVAILVSTIHLKAPTPATTIIFIILITKAIITKYELNREEEITINIEKGE